MSRHRSVTRAAVMAMFSSPWGNRPDSAILPGRSSRAQRGVRGESEKKWSYCSLLIGFSRSIFARRIFFYTTTAVGHPVSHMMIREWSKAILVRHFLICTAHGTVVSLRKFLMLWRLLERVTALYDKKTGWVGTEAARIIKT